VGMASRIAGVSPADVAGLVVYARRAAGGGGKGGGPAAFSGRGRNRGANPPVASPGTPPARRGGAGAGEPHPTPPPPHPRPAAPRPPPAPPPAPPPPPARPGRGVDRMGWNSLRPLLEVDSAAVIERVRGFARELLRWNQHVSNLVSRSDESRLVDRHIRES